MIPIATQNDISNIRTGSGDVDCVSVTGNIKTGSGDVTQW